MKLLNMFLAFVCLFFLEGCASSGETVLLGMGIGTLSGASMGAIAGAGPKGIGRTQNVAVGAAVGSIIGAGTAYFFHKKKEENSSSQRMRMEISNFQNKFKASEKSSEEPILVLPRIETTDIRD